MNCAHCNTPDPTRPASIPDPRDGRRRLQLCHTDDLASDCYRLVTVYQHQPDADCDRCEEERVTVAAVSAGSLRRMVVGMLRHGAAPRPWRSSDGDERCQECVTINPCWWAPHEVWDDVMAGDKGAVLCPSCFIRRAERTGIGQRGAWQLYPPGRLTDA